MAEWAHTPERRDHGAVHFDWRSLLNELHRAFSVA